jgi:NAD(P)-dependent dehydrogenase (short-subunit alcohol dehydrogenase family)
MSGSLRDKTVVITGGSGEVGWGIAHAAREAGATLVLPVRREEARAALETEFGTARTWVAVTDFGDDQALGRLRDEATRRFGAIDHVVAPLGAWWQKGPSLGQPTSELRALLDAYVDAQFRLLSTMAPSLRTSAGSYTFVTGAAGDAPSIPGAGLLVAAVKAQLGLSQVLRHELMAEPFRVNEVRIGARIERTPRAGVVPSQLAGRAFVDVMTGEARGALFRYGADQRLVIT